jgi:hypothetical protein
MGRAATNTAARWKHPGGVDLDTAQGEGREPAPAKAELPPSACGNSKPETHKKNNVCVNNEFLH